MAEAHDEHIIFETSNENVCIHRILIIQFSVDE